MTNIQKVIFDTDGGGDDLWALLLLLDAHKRGDIQLMGVTSVYGNTSLDNASNNLIDFIEHCGIPDVPVFIGAKRPLVQERGLADNAFGTNGLSKGRLPTGSRNFAQQSAHDFLSETLSKTNDPISIIATGPTTNLGRLFQENPSLDKSNIDILWMGGAILPSGGDHLPLVREDGTFNRGNITPFTEFNAANDVYALQILFQLKNVNLTIFPMDPGQHADFGSKDQGLLRALMAENDQAHIAENLINFLQGVIELDRMKQKMEGTPIYDAQTAQNFLGSINGDVSVFPKSLPIINLRVTNRPNLVPLFLAASDQGEFRPDLLQDHGQMFADTDPSGQSNIHIIPGLYTFNESASPQAKAEAETMGRRRVNDLVARTARAASNMEFS